MKILHTESSLGWGGQEIRVLTEARGVLRRGHEVAIAVARGSRIQSEAPHFGIVAIELPIARKRAGAVLALRRHLALSRYDVVNTHSSTDSWLTTVAVKLLPRPPAIVRTRHISAPLPANAATRWLYRQAAHTVTTGERLKWQVAAEADLDPAHITSVPTGIDLMRFHPGDRDAARERLGLPTAAPIIGIVATLRDWKGHAHLLEALASSARRDVLLLIVGDGPQRQALEGRARALGIDSRVLFAGNQRDVVPWMHAMDVFCLPSYANEGVPQALAQAMACGLPVISTRVGSIEELVEDNRTGVLVPHSQPPALRAAIEAMLADAPRRQALGAAATRETRERAGEDRMVDAMLRIFAAVA